MSITIEPATEADFDAIWNIFQHVIAGGNTYIYDDDTTKAQAHTIFMESGTAYVAKENDKVLGCVTIRPNKVGRGSHVGNASYIVCPNNRGKKIGQRLGEFSLQQAKKDGFTAMQFNFVVSTNTPAVKLWQKLGFNIIGTIPGGYRHKEKGMVDAYIMYRAL